MVEYLKRDIKVYQDLFHEMYRDVTDLKNTFKKFDNLINEIEKVKESHKELMDLYSSLHERYRILNPYMSKRESQILNLLKMNRPKTEIAKQLNVDNSTVTYYVRKLHKKKLI
jgi:DNA-binding NarL/FixJ family response regulator